MNTGKLLKVAIPAALAFTVAACESRVDTDRKPDVMEPMIEQSLDRCDRSVGINNDDAAYAARLREVMNSTWTQNLETIRDNGATICLDQRLSQQDHPWYNSEILGVYYNHADGDIVSLWDHGRPSSENRLLVTDTTDAGARLLNDLGDEIRHGDIPQDENAYGSVYGRYSAEDWRVNHFGQDTLRRNPDIVRTAPVRAPST